MTFPLENLAEDLRREEKRFKDALNNFISATRRVDQSRLRFYDYADKTGQKFRQVKVKDGTVYRANDMDIS